MSAPAKQPAPATPPAPRRVALDQWSLVDALAWVVGILLAGVLLREDGIAGLRGMPWSGLLIAGLVAAVLHLVMEWVSGRRTRGLLPTSQAELTGVLRRALFAAIGVQLLLVITDLDLAVYSIPWLGGALAVVIMLVARTLTRAARTHAVSRRHTGRRVIVYGAGEAGQRLVHNMFDDRTYLPVAMVDDDPAKQKLRIEGVPVSGVREDIPRLAREFDASLLVVAIATAGAEVVQLARQEASSAGMELKVLPTVNNLLSNDPHVRDIRDLDLQDVLGRRAVELDQEEIGAALAGKVVLVTGAGGSIGSELCRQIARYSPGRIVLLDRDESTMLETHLSLTGRGLLEGEDLKLVDIRDAQAVREAFERVRPDVVFHAAALKHLPLLERHPREAWHTNVLGTLNVLTAAAAVGVSSFVNISTDKAASPTSVLGYSKRIAERLTAAFAMSEPHSYVSVRFGNVLGSRGSVIPIFTEQIRRGGPVTVTDPRVERFFMLIPEACQLVMQAATVSGNGDVMVLDMGDPVRIADVAHTLIELSGRTDVEVTYTGLRPGEKMTEVLFADREDQRPTTHPLVAAVTVAPLDGEVVRTAVVNSQEEALRVMTDLVRSENNPPASTV